MNSSAHGLITLLTDFGYRDSYVGLIKGVMIGIMPQVSLVDLTHGIPPQDVALGRFELAQAVPYFPVGTIHLAVVDPGVGSDRLGIAVDCGQGWLVGPNNGLFGGVLQRYPARRAVVLNRPQWWRVPDPSFTFHGRDIFAPIAAYLAQGVPLEALGSPLDLTQLVELPWQPPSISAQGIRGHIQAIDGFGNLITTISPQNVLELGTIVWPQNSAWAMTTGGLVYGQNRLPLSQTYSDIPPGQPLTLWGSHGYLEIALAQGNAQAYFQAQVGDEVMWQVGEIGV